MKEHTQLWVMKVNASTIYENILGVISNKSRICTIQTQGYVQITIFLRYVSGRELLLANQYRQRNIHGNPYSLSSVAHSTIGESSMSHSHSFPLYTHHIFFFYMDFPNQVRRNNQASYAIPVQSIYHYFVVDFPSLVPCMCKVMSWHDQFSVLFFVQIHKWQN